MVKKGMRKKAKRRAAGLRRKILGVVKGKEEDDGFFRAQSHVTKHYD